MKTLITAFILSFIFISCKGQSKFDLNAVEFQQGIANTDSVQLLDVRTSAEFNSGHIAKALWADWNDRKEFDRRISFIDKNKPVYVYCLAGGRSASAAGKLRSLGYTQVFELAGGTNAWKAAKLPLEGKKNSVQMSAASFQQAITSEQTVLVDFGAPWCPPCKKMEPVINSLQKNNPGKFKLVNVDGGNDEIIMQEYGVTALPVFIIFKNGKEVWRKEGLATESEIAAQL